MALKAMVFIDGGWLYRSRQTLFTKLGEERGFEIDYARLPRLVCDDMANAIDEDVSLVRTLYFGTVPSARSGFNTGKQRAFYDFLEKSCNYDIDIHEVDVGTDGVRQDDTWLRVALSSAMVFYAGQHGAYDAAVIVGDDVNYTPALRRVRMFGKRVQIVSLHGADGHPPPVGASLLWKSRVSDFPPLYLDDHAADLRLVRERVKRVCKQCGTEEETTWAGPDFFCSACRDRHNTV